MITVPAGVRIYLALGATDMCKEYDGLALLLQEVLRADPFSGPRQSLRLIPTALRHELFCPGSGCDGLDAIWPGDGGVPGSALGVDNGVVAVINSL